MLRFISNCINNLFRRKLRTAFALGGVALAIAALVSLQGATRGFLRQFEQITSRLRGEILLVQRGAPDPLLSDLKPELEGQLRKLPVVRQVYPLAHYITKISISDDINQLNAAAIPRLFVLFAMPPDSELVRRHELLRGRYFRNGKREVVLGELAAKQMKLNLGGVLRINRSLVYKVVGIYKTAIQLVDFGAITSIRDYAALRGHKNVNAYVLDLHGGRSRIPEAQKLIQSLHPNLEALDSAKLLNHAEHIKLINAFGFGVSIIAVCIAALGVLNIMLMSVHERTREIGLLSAIGWSTRRIMSMILFESLLLGALGGAIGIVLGIAGTTWLLSVVDIGIVEARYPASFLLKAFLASVAVGVLGALLPAWRASSISPLEALRSE